MPHQLHDFSVPMLGGAMRCTWCSTLKALPPTPSVRGSATSEAAARSMPDSQRTIDKTAILAAIADAGHDGLTSEKVEEITHIAGNTVRPRIVELAKEQAIRLNGKTRMTRAGRSAQIWVVS